MTELSCCAQESATCWKAQPAGTAILNRSGKGSNLGPLGNVNQITKNIANPAVPETVSFPPGTFLARLKKATPEISAPPIAAHRALKILSIRRCPEFRLPPLLMLYIRNPTNTAAKMTPTQNCCCCRPSDCCVLA